MPAGRQLHWLCSRTRLEGEDVSLGRGEGWARSSAPSRVDGNGLRAERWPSQGLRRLDAGGLAATLCPFLFWSLLLGTEDKGPAARPRILG